MRFAICNETFVDWPFDRAMAFARQCGYTGVEIAPFTLCDAAPSHVRHISAGRRREIRRQADEAGMEVVALHWILAKTAGFHLTSPHAMVRRATSEYFVELATLCRDLGGSILVLGSPQQRNLSDGLSTDDGMQYAADVLSAALPTCESLDVTIAVEPLGPSEGNFLLTAEEAIRLIHAIDSPHLRLHLDCKAMASEEAPIADVIRASGEHLVHFHANDANRRGPGMGDVDFGPIFDALGDVDYRGWVSVEVFDYSPGVERLVRESIDYMQRVLG